MTTFATILRRAGWLLGGRIASQGLGVAFTVLLAARLGAAGFGTYAVIAAVIYVANVVTTFGTDMILIRELAAGESTDGWATALIVQVGLTAVAIGVIWFLAGALPGEPAEAAVALRVLSWSLVPAAVWSIASAVLRGTGRMAHLAALGTLGAALQVAAAWWLVGGPDGLVRAAGALVMAQVVTAVAAVATVAVSTDVLARRPSLDPRAIVRMVRASAPVGVLGLLGVLYQRLTVIGVSFLAGPMATAWFAGGARVVEASKAGHVALYGALYPAMAEGGRVAGAPSPARRAVHRSLWVSLGAAAMISAGLVLGAPLAIRLLFGPDFAPASGGLAILGLSVVPSTLATYLSLEVVALHREEVALRALVVSLALLLILVAVLVPRFGWTGGCWAVVVAESVQAMTLAASRGLGLRPGRLGARPRRAADRSIVPEGAP